MSYPTTWRSTFEQKRKGDPRKFVQSQIVQDSLKASKYAYEDSTPDIPGWKKVQTITAKPQGSGKLVALLGGGLLRADIYVKQDLQTGHNELMVSFKGTDNLTSLWQDVQLLGSTNASGVIAGAKGSLHSGFASAYLSLKSQIKEVTDLYYAPHLIFTGHSLGGALASIASADDWGTESVEAVTFAAPQIGDADFSKWYTSSGKHQDRIIQAGDPVVVGNLKYQHADESAYVVGSNNGIDFGSHKLSSYEDSIKDIDRNAWALNGDEYVYPQLQFFLSIEQAARQTYKAWKYMNAAAELYDVVDVASGLTLNRQTLQHILADHEGPLWQTFSSTVSKIKLGESISVASFKAEFVERLTRLLPAARTEIVKDALLFRDTTTLSALNEAFMVQNGKLVLAADVATSTKIGLLDDVTNYFDIVKSEFNTGTKIATTSLEVVTYEAPSKILSGANSNYQALVRAGEDIGEASVLQSAQAALRAGRETFANIKSTAGKILAPLGKVVNVLGGALDVYNIVNDIDDLAHGEGDWKNLAFDSFSLGVSLAALAAELGLISVAVPVAGAIALFVVGVTALIVASTSDSSPTKSDIHKALRKVYDYAKENDIDIKDASSAQEFADKHVDSSSIDGDSLYIDGFKAQDFLHKPILTPGKIIRASVDPESYRKARVLELLYPKLLESKLTTDIEIDFVGNWLDHVSFDAKGTLLLDQRPVEDAFFPPEYYQGKRIYPSENVDLYNKVMDAEIIHNSFPTIFTQSKESFIDEYALSTSRGQDGTILINGRPVEDTVYPPITVYGTKIYISDNADLYNGYLMAEYYYDKMAEFGLNTGVENKERFLELYYSQMTLDGDGNILIQHSPALFWDFVPVTDPDGKQWYRVQDATYFDKVKAVQNTDFLSLIKDKSGKSVNAKDFWDENKDSIRVMPGQQISLGMTKEELKDPRNQLFMLRQYETNIKGQGLDLSHDYYRAISRLERAVMNKEQLELFTTLDGHLIYQDSDINQAFLQQFSYGGKTYIYGNDPQRYLAAWQLSLNPENDYKTTSDLDKAVQDTIKDIRMPSSSLSQFNGPAGKSIGLLSYDDMPSSIQHEQEIQDELLKFRQEQRLYNQALFDEDLPPVASQVTNKTIAGNLYDQLNRKGTTLDMSREEFIDLYAPTILVDAKGNVRLSDKSTMLFSPSIRVGDEVVHRVENPKLWEQYKALDELYSIVSKNGYDVTRDDFFKEYQGRVSVDDNGDVLLDQKIFGHQDQRSGMLDINPFGNTNNGPTDDSLANPLSDHLTNSIGSTEGGINVHSQMVHSAAVALNSIGNEEAASQFLDEEDRKTPGTLGFVPDGQKLKFFKKASQWWIIFENGEQDGYPELTKRIGSVVMGNWCGALPITGPPINTLDSYMMAYHIQSQKSESAAVEDLGERIMEAIHMRTIEPYKDVREFEVASFYLKTIDEHHHVFEVEQVMESSADGLFAKVSTAMAKLYDHRKVPGALPENVDLEKIRLVPKRDDGKPVLKRAIEAAGILGDVYMQNKFRKVQYDYTTYQETAWDYMKRIDEHNDNLQPALDRPYTDGVILQEQMYDRVVTEVVDMLNRPITDLFEIK